MAGEKGSDVNKATTLKAKAKATYLKAKNTTTGQLMYSEVIFSLHSKSVSVPSVSS